MKKKLILIAVCSMLLIPLLSMGVTATDEPQIEYVLLKGGFGVNLWISNVGQTTVSDIEWTLEFQGCYMFSEKSFSGIINSISPGEKIKISTGPVFGLPSRGSNIFIDITYPGSTQWGYAFSHSAYVFGPFVFLPACNPPL